MTPATPTPPVRVSAEFIAIACGGTGGHLFPGLAVAEQLVKRGCAVTLLISPKEVDQAAVKHAQGVEVVTLPAVAMQRGSRLAFLRGCWQSWRAARELFQTRPPHAALAMGGFTSAPPILAARSLGAKTFLHESNTIPGRANRWLARFVDQAFVGFPSTVSRLHVREATVTGTPVRLGVFLPLPARNERGEGRGEGRPDETTSSPQPSPPSAGGEGETAARFQARASCRTALGLDPAKPVLLVMGGSQGASGINEMVLSALPILAKCAPHWQWLHLTGPNDFEKVKRAYAALNVKAVVHPFFAEMNLALGAATAAVSRAGASSLAELAAMRLPSLLVPFPYAADNHQFHNARAFAESGAALLLEQKDATPEKVAGLLVELVENATAREKIQTALERWHAPKAAEQIAEAILKAVGSELSERVGKTGRPTPDPSQEGNSRVARAAEFPSWEGSGVGSFEMAQLIEKRA
jgi:UDP-N-acetylglucosamine--N-acetylmuramyl-(pentapeptide) pyrophosphoryl-undecaprenol N-acetylglucosamine transferase